MPETKHNEWSKRGAKVIHHVLKKDDGSDWKINHADYEPCAICEPDIKKREKMTDKDWIKLSKIKAVA